MIILMISAIVGLGGGLSLAIASIQLGWGNSNSEIESSRHYIKLSFWFTVLSIISITLMYLFN